MDQHSPSMERVGATLLVHLPGQLPTELLPELRRQLEEAVQAPGLENVVVDLQAATFMDSSGIGLLVTLKGWAAQYGRALNIYKPGPQVMKALNLVHLANTFAFLHDASSLEAMLGPSSTLQAQP